jgi:hypothetical protein
MLCKLLPFCWLAAGVPLTAGQLLACRMFDDYPWEDDQKPYIARSVPGEAVQWVATEAVLWRELVELAASDDLVEHVQEQPVEHPLEQPLQHPPRRMKKTLRLDQLRNNWTTRHELGSLGGYRICLLWTGSLHRSNACAALDIIPWTTCSAAMLILRFHQ